MLLSFSTSEQHTQTLPHLRYRDNLHATLSRLRSRASQESCSKHSCLENKTRWFNSRCRLSRKSLWKLKSFMIKRSTLERSFSSWSEKTWSAFDKKTLGWVKARLRVDDPRLHSDLFLLVSATVCVLIAWAMKKPRASRQEDYPISFNLSMVEYTNLLKAAVGQRLRSKLYYNRMSDL